MTYIPTIAVHAVDSRLNQLDDELLDTQFEIYTIEDQVPGLVEKIEAARLKGKGFATPTKKLKRLSENYWSLRAKVNSIAPHASGEVETLPPISEDFKLHNLDLDWMVEDIERESSPSPSKPPSRAKKTTGKRKVDPSADEVSRIYICNHPSHLYLFITCFILDKIQPGTAKKSRKQSLKQESSSVLTPPSDYIPPPIPSLTFPSTASPYTTQYYLPYQSHSANIPFHLPTPLYPQAHGAFYNYPHHTSHMPTYPPIPVPYMPMFLPPPPAPHQSLPPNSSLGAAPSSSQTRPVLHPPK